MKPICIAAFFLLTCFSSVSAQTRKSDLPRFRISFQGGWSYRLAKVADVEPVLREYIKGLKSGFHLGVDGSYFFTENYGAGLKYAYFNAKNEKDNVTITDWNGGETRTGLMKDNVHIHYIAPAFYTRFPLADNKLVFLAGASIGYLRYVDNAVLISDVKITGGTLGVGFDVGMDYMITPRFGVGANLGLIGGSLSKLNYSDGASEMEVKLEDGQRENLTRLDVSAGVRWCF